MDKNRLKTRFKRFYPGKRLLAVQLDGFSHAVIFDGGSRDSAVQRDTFSHCMPEGRWSDAATGFFAEIPNHSYQNAAREIVYIAPESR